jgi:hypothetical protein
LAELAFVVGQRLDPDAGKLALAVHRRPAGLAALPALGAFRGVDALIGDLRLLQVLGAVRLDNGI